MSPGMSARGVRMLVSVYPFVKKLLFKMQTVYFSLSALFLWACLCSLAARRKEEKYIDRF